MLKMTTDVEEWRPILGTNGRYVVSNFGRIQNLFPKKGANCILAGVNDGKGYRRIPLTAHGRPRRLWLIHQLVALAFLGDCPKGKNINHIDSNRANNRADNLEYVTQLENQRHSWRTNNRKPPHHGEATHFAKLTEQDVIRIRDLRSHGLTYAEIAIGFNTKPANIWHICTGRTWKHLL